MSVLPPPVRAPAHAAIIVAAIGSIAFVNIGGAARGVRFINAATMIKLIPLAVFVIAGAGAIHSANYLPTAQPSTGGLGRALLLALFAFTGMETSLTASGEVARMDRQRPAGQSAHAVRIRA